MKTDANMAADGEVKTEADMAAEGDAKVEKTEAEMAATDGAERELLPRPAVEREGYTEADMAAVRQMTSEDLEGTAVYGANDESVGEIDSLVIGEDGKVSEVVINVGGFLGLGEKPVAVTFDELQILQETDGDDLRVYIDSTEERLEAQPEFEG